MYHLRLLFTNIAMWILDRVMFYWNTGSDGQPVIMPRFPVTIVYSDGAIEVIPLDTDIKIGEDGTVYFKDKTKNKWIAYPEVIELVYTKPTGEPPC